MALRGRILRSREGLWFLLGMGVPSGFVRRCVLEHGRGIEGYLPQDIICDFLTDTLEMLLKRVDVAVVRSAVGIENLHNTL